jgi:hypothetical protein
MVNQSYTPVSAERWADIKNEFAQQAGVTITTDTGAAVSHGVHFSWAYGGDALAITVDSVPWALKMVGLSEQAVLDKFSTWINGVQ